MVRIIGTDSIYGSMAAFHLLKLAHNPLIKQALLIFH